MAENQAFKQKVVGSAPGMLAAVHQHPHLAKGLGVDQRFGDAFHNNPVLTVLLQTLLGFVADFYVLALHHIPDIGLVLQYIGDALAGPQAGVWAGIGDLFSDYAVRGRRMSQRGSDSRHSSF